MFDDIIRRPVVPAGTQAMSKEFIANVFSYMFAALAISGLTAYSFGTSSSLMSYLINAETGSFSMFGYIVMFAPIGVALWMQMGFARLSMMMLTALLVVYSLLIGMSLSFILLIYSGSSIATTFFVAAGTFGAMALLGYTTKTDLTKMGNIMYMLFIGIFIGFLVNFFLQNEVFDYILSFIGIIVFTGLTAWKMQELKYFSANADYADVNTRKMALIGGLQLYILFINLFLVLLRFLGNRD